MKNSSKLWQLFLLSITIMVIIFLSAGLSKSTLQRSQPFPVWIFNYLEPGEVPPDEVRSEEEVPIPPIGLWYRLGFFILIGLLTLWVITFILHPEARKRMLIRMISYLTLLLIIFLVYSKLKPPELVNQNGGDDVEIGPGGIFTQEEPPVTPTLVADPPQWLVVTITLAFIILILGVIWFVWQRRPRRTTWESPKQLLALEARRAIETLQAGSDLKDTVLRCYQEMSQVLKEQRGIQRQKGMTPREFEKHLVEIGLRDEHIRRLTRLFEGVRYGDNVSSERDKREALDCLRAIVRAYGGAS
jgi:hypothetical protein